MTESSGRILKADAAKQLSSRLAFNFEDLRQHAADQLVEARAEAARILDDAQVNAQRIKQTAAQEGQQAGYQAGLENAQKQIQQEAKKLADRQLQEQLKGTLPALGQLSRALQQERQAWLTRWEQTAVELAVAIAGKLLRTTLAAEPERVIPMIREALQLAAGQTQVRVFLHPQDLLLLGDEAEQVVQSLTACATAELITDPQLNQGDCRLETRHGEVDARLETMLQRITDELLI
jgi:flagellar assembly protein FliH